MNGVGWRTAMETALYGPDGFFVRDAEGPGEHFRTSVHASPLFAGAVARLLHRTDEALGHPPVFAVVDVGAGRGELLTALLGAGLPERMRLVAVEKAPRPAGLNPRIDWRATLPEPVVGAVLATEWLDNVPLDVAEVDAEGRLRRVLVDRDTGAEAAGPGVDAGDRLWCARWWPDAAPGERVEIGWTRDAAWSEAVGLVRRGIALAVDYGHRKGERPRHGTMTGYRGGRQVAPVPDGTTDVTAHVAMDAVAVAGGWPYTLITQREALRALGVDGARPPLDLARSDPAAYLRALNGAGAAAELTDPDGLGGHWWLLQSVGLDAAARGTMLG